MNRPLLYALKASHVSIRRSSHSTKHPMHSLTTAKKVTIPGLQAMYHRKEPIAMVTAHDFPSSHAADQAGMDMILVGDSLAMTSLGAENTCEVLLDEMLLHCRSVARGVTSAFIVGDLPMGSYEISAEQALGSAIRMMKEGHVHAVKLEGGVKQAETIAKITAAGIPVLAHIGLTPQSEHSLGGFRVQGKSALGAMKVLEDGLAVQKAGAFAVVLEAIPAKVAAFVTNKLKIPTISIGAGKDCSGQVLVQSDLSGNFPNGQKLPKFVKQYGKVWAETMKSIGQYRSEVKSGMFPSMEHTYSIPDEEYATFERTVEGQALQSETTPMSKSG